MISNPHLINGKLTLDLFPIEMEDQYKKIIELIRKNFNAEDEEYTDGPGFSYSIVKIKESYAKIYYMQNAGVFAESDEQTLEMIKGYIDGLLSDN